MQLLSTSKASLGALRQAHSFVTSSQPDGSASPIGIRQLKIQEGCPVTAGRAVIVYSAAEALAAAMLADVDMLDMLASLDVEDWPIARARKDKKIRSFIVEGDFDLGGSLFGNVGC
jgi:hypothetical protein